MGCGRERESKRKTGRKKTKEGREGERRKKKKIAGLKKACPQRVYNSYNDVDNSFKLIVFPL